jgi:hypothetical protein
MNMSANSRMDHKKVKGIAVLLGNMLRALKVNGME